jgi:hypothetical protein
VLQPERVADLVRNDVLQQATHQLIGHGQRFRSRVKRGNLYEIPVADQVHHVVIELNVRLDDFACPRI